MNDINLYILNFEKTNLKLIVNNFINKIKNNLEEENLQKSFEKINNLIDSLIDLCIKNKISYFIDNNISFTSIKINFKIELENILLEILKNKYTNIETELNNLIQDDFINIKNNNEFNELLYKFTTNNSKNKVKFSNVASEYIFKNKEHNKINKKKIKSIKINLIEENKELSVDNKLVILLKTLFIEEENLKIFEKKILNICKIINDLDIEYDILQPYKKE
jgi:hypothetical protein